MSYKIVIKYIPQMTIGLSEEVHTAEFPFREKEKCQDALDFLENLIAEGLACGLVNYELVCLKGDDYYSDQDGIMWHDRCSEKGSKPS